MVTINTFLLQHTNTLLYRLDSNPDADVEELKSQKKQLEDAVQPIIAKLYAGAGPAGQEPPADTSSEKDEL